MRTRVFMNSRPRSEIIEQMNGTIDAVVIGAGTSGTFVRCFEGSEKTESQRSLCSGRAGRIDLWRRKPLGQRRLKASGSVDFIPKIYDASLADEIMMVTTMRSLCCA